MSNIEKFIKKDDTKIDTKTVIQSKIDKILKKIELKFLPSLFYK